MIVSGGSNLSRGEQQRLALTKALLRKPAVLALDEALSSLPEQHVSLIMEQIYAHLKGMTMFLFVDHRQDTFPKAGIAVDIQNGTLGC